MEGVTTADRVAVDNGTGAVPGKILWQKDGVLEWVLHINERAAWDADLLAGWAKYMTWKYPIDVVITSPGAYKGAGAVEAAASL